MHLRSLALTILLFTTPAVAAEPPVGLLWAATPAGADAPAAWVLASPPAGPDELLDLPATIEYAWSSSRGLVLEVDPGALTDEQTGAIIKRLAFYDDGRTLGSTLPAPLWESLLDRLGPQGGADFLALQEPWFVSFLLRVEALEAAGLKPSNSLDRFFLLRAGHRKLPVFALDTAEAQLSWFDGMPEALQQATLADAVASERMVSAARAAFDAWWRGDAAALDAALAGEPERALEYAEWRKGWQQDRNASFARQITARIADGPLFVVVEQSRVVGQGSLLDALRAQGWTVDQRR